MTSIRDRQISELFDEERAEEYGKRLDGLWERLHRANDSMYVFDRVDEFPWDLFFPPMDRIFMSRVLRNFLDAVVLILVDALTSKDPKSVTFKTLKRWIVTNCRCEVRSDVKAHLAALPTPGQMSELLDRARGIRDKMVAHLDKKPLVDAPTRAHLRITRKELRYLVDQANQIFVGLCFGDGKGMTSLWYHPELEHPSQTRRGSDIERFLDLLAEHSQLMHWPEEHKELWAGRAPTLTKEERKQFNYWRTRVGLPEVPFE